MVYNPLILFAKSILFLFCFGVLISVANFKNSQFRQYVVDVMIYEYGAFTGMTTGTGNRSVRREPAPMTLLPQQISHLTSGQTRAAGVGRQRLTY
jgi:hypothetical protein